MTGYHSGKAKLCGHKSKGHEGILWGNRGILYFKCGGGYTALCIFSKLIEFYI